jgi:hypothetical protein
MVIRDQPPAEGSTAAISPPEGVVMPPGVLGRPAN